MSLQMSAGGCSTLIDHATAAVHPWRVDQRALLILGLGVADAAAEVGGTDLCIGMLILLQLWTA